MSDTTTDWIRPGAPVVLYNTGGSGASRNVRRTTIKKVAAKSFTVESEDARFPLDRLSVPQGGAWGWTRHVTPADSDKAREVLAEAARQAADSRARGAVDAWTKDRSRGNRLAAIAALQAVEESS